MFTHSTTKRLKPVRKKLRNSQTPAELLLWQHLKSRQLDNRKFRRQHSLGRYIYDFYCREEKLVIELDGSIHADEKVHQNDIKKENYAKSISIKVLRYNNIDVFRNLNLVLKDIKNNFQYTSPPLSKDKGRCSGL